MQAGVAVERFKHSSGELYLQYGLQIVFSSPVVQVEGSKRSYLAEVKKSVDEKRKTFFSFKEESGIFKCLMVQEFLKCHKDGTFAWCIQVNGAGQDKISKLERAIQEIFT